MSIKQRKEQIMSKYRDSKPKRRGISVEVKDDLGRALRTWSKKVQDSGLLKEIKDRGAFEKPAVKKQRMRKQARRRWERQVEEMMDLGLWHRDRNY
jgi:ribosomal protein S21